MSTEHDEEVANVTQDIATTIKVNHCLQWNLFYRQFFISLKLHDEFIFNSALAAKISVVGQLYRPLIILWQ